jgi:hypothetical protein
MQTTSKHRRLFVTFISIATPGSYLIQELWPRANFRLLRTSGAEQPRLWTALLFLFSIGFASGCSAPEFRGSTAKFGEAVQASASGQTDRLGKLTATQVDDIRGGLAAERVYLAYSPGCAELLIPGASPKNCKVIRADGQAIPEAKTFASILALNKALGSYGKSLALLAEDSSEDSAAFNKSLLDMVASVEGLEVALSNSGSGEASDPSGFNVFATGLTKVSGAFFAASRARKLRKIIIAADPKIQAATKILSRASEGLATFEITHAIEGADRTQVALKRSLSSGAKTAKIAALQAKLFDDVAQIRRIARLKDSYAVIGKSHGELTKAAHVGSNKEDLSAAIVELLQVVTALKDLDT